MNLLQIACFWRNEHPGGFGFILGGPNLHEVWDKIIADYESEYAQSKDRVRLLDFLEDQCRWYATANKSLSMKEGIKWQWLIAGNLYPLQQHGRIDPSDDYNGVVMLYVPNSSLNSLDPATGTGKSWRNVLKDDQRK